MNVDTLGILVGALVGALFSWPISHWYYRRSSQEATESAKTIPEWAKPLIEKLPDAPVTTERLIELYHEALEIGEIRPDPISGYVKCPKCGASSDQFESWEAGDAARDQLYRGRRCKACGYDVHWEEV